MFNESNPYARMGQLEVCKARQCKKCAKIQVKSNGIYNEGWKNIKSFISEKISHTTQNDNVAYIASIVDIGTPVVDKL